MQTLNFPVTEFKLAGSESEMTFSGYGAVFGNVDSYGDVIQSGAFSDTLAAAQKTGQFPAMLMQHGGWGIGADDMTPIGIWTSLAEDGHGLKVEGKLADTPRGREAYALLKMQPRPAITGLSIGYIAKEWAQRSKPEEPRRTLKKVDLLEVSLVTFPANPKARVQSVKSGLDIRIAEKALRDAGFSRTEAKAILSRGFSALDLQREAVDEWAELAAIAAKNFNIPLQYR
jgi:HK97 family phage prohead protease